VLFAVLFVAASFFVFKDNREATYGTIYVSTSAQMRMLTQRIAKAAQRAHRRPERSSSCSSRAMSSSPR